jgi:uncharacterized membrane protein YjfL (UPF0719 family)
MKKEQIKPAVIIVSLLAASVPISLFATSIFIECLFIYWCLEGVAFHQETGFFKTISSNGKLVLQGIGTKLNLFIKNPAAVAFSSLYLLFLAGCFWSSNYHYSLQELREKLPILLLPILFTGIKPFTESELKKILISFISGVLMGTLLGIYILLTQHIADTRELSPYMSHIRFSMNICLAIFILFRFIVKGSQLSIPERTLYLFLFCWLIVFLFILKSLTGILLFAVFSLYVLVYFSRQLKTRWLRNGVTFLLVLFPIIIFSYLYNIYNRHISVALPNLSLLETNTAAGNPYMHDTINFKVENGRYVGLYICEQELKQSWERRSHLNYNGKNLQGEELRYTIIRYLNSKGYRKDAVGLSKLTPNEITDIEKGVANSGLIQPFNLSARIEGFFIDLKQYRRTGNANGKSELQRLEYWKIALFLIKQHVFAGVGTGDVEDAFTKEYERSHSKLDNRFRGTSHNQYLYMGVAFGIGGILLFLFWLILPPLYLGAFRDYYFAALFCIIILSMLTEDSLLPQAGLNFYAFFGTLFLFGRAKKTKQ